jgi:hypothetical protein
MPYTQSNDVVLLLTNLFKELSENHGDLVWTIVEYNWFPGFLDDFLSLACKCSGTDSDEFFEFVEKYYKEINLLIGKDDWFLPTYADSNLDMQFLKDNAFLVAARELQPKVLKILSEFEQ